MLVTNQILHPVIYPLVNLTIWARLSSLVGNDKDIWYRINGGIFLFAATVTSTTCGDMGFVGNLKQGDVVDLLAQDNITDAAKTFHSIDNSNSCASTGGTDHGDDTNLTCGDLFTVTMGTTDKDVSMYILNTGCV